MRLERFEPKKEAYPYDNVAGAVAGAGAIGTDEDAGGFVPRGD